MASTRFWGQAPQREYTARRLCPGPVGSEPHASRWWRWVDLNERDGWHCLTCGWTAPEVSPIDGLPVEQAVPLAPLELRIVERERQMQDYLRAA